MANFNSLKYNLDTVMYVIVLINPNMFFIRLINL